MKAVRATKAECKAEGMCMRLGNVDAGKDHREKIATVYFRFHEISNDIMKICSVFPLDAQDFELQVHEKEYKD